MNSINIEDFPKEDAKLITSEDLHKDMIEIKGTIISFERSINEMKESIIKSINTLSKAIFDRFGKEKMTKSKKFVKLHLKYINNLNLNSSSSSSKRSKSI